jgi:signal transduction histidine kinase
MHDPELARILEPALHALIASRCHRAYRHDLRNGLQGIYGGFDALGRLLQTPARDAAKVERTTDFVRQAITGHEKSLERVLHGLAPLEQPAELIDAGVMLQELAKFLTNDAAAQRVSLRTSVAEPAPVRVRPQKLRLALLSLLIDAIDAIDATASGSALQLASTVANDRVLIELADSRPVVAEVDPWALDLTTVPPQRGLTLFVVRQLVLGEGGTIECESGAGRTVRISLGIAK